MTTWANNAVDMEASATANAFDADLIVIGAGIHGAAVAREAAARGWSVMVLEQHEQPARETSSRSSKLIHGGLRYLENADFALVHECLREQAILLRTAPHLVKSQRFFIPMVPHMKRPRWQLQIGLWLYWLLGGRRPGQSDSNAHIIDGLNNELISQCLVYRDAQTDDAGLTRAVLASAEMMGARVHYSTSPAHIELHEHHVELRLQGAQTQTLRARAIANLSGIWINDVLAKVSPAQPAAKIDLVKGSHIVLPDAPIQGCYYLEAEDQRAVFVMPWRGMRLIGTTEIPCPINTRQPEPSEPEIDYLLRTYNRYFKTTAKRSDVKDSWAGLRVLPQGEGEAFSRPRESIYLLNRQRQPRLVSLVGGKLTSHRATAVSICKHLQAVMPKTPWQADTRHQALPQRSC